MNRSQPLSLDSGREYKSNQGWHFWLLFLKTVLFREGQGGWWEMKGRYKSERCAPKHGFWRLSEKTDFVILWACAKCFVSTISFLAWVYRKPAMAYSGLEGSGQRVTSPIFLKFRKGSARNSKVSFKWSYPLTVFLIWVFLGDALKFVTRTPIECV